ncbi:hypothetical protein [Actinacidiphila sp. ITFR-21]|uniref:hypothetical protein n=1 Tax=Actinacidiphila sp. ITFR-21 TaxID=3075199 RepID=UPI002889FF66|nr:hypothetical protein [Streptomyces sp. ITFR-21]WNI17394.1 hypothetical protein RLT57_18985 [Streptomyces sp. ITFR-21]
MSEYGRVGTGGAGAPARAAAYPGADAMTAARLRRLLAAAGLPAALDPAREEAALAAFRAAHPPVGPVPRPVVRAGRAVRVAAAAMVSVVALGGVGVAVAAGTGHGLLPGPGSGTSRVSRPPAVVAPDGDRAGPVSASAAAPAPASGAAAVPGSAPALAPAPASDPLPPAGAASTARPADTPHRDRPVGPHGPGAGPAGKAKGAVRTPGAAPGTPGGKAAPQQTRTPGGHRRKAQDKPRPDARTPESGGSQVTLPGGQPLY